MAASSVVVLEVLLERGLADPLRARLLQLGHLLAPGLDLLPQGGDAVLLAFELADVPLAEPPLLLCVGERLQVLAEPLLVLFYLLDLLLRLFDAALEALDVRRRNPRGASTRPRGY